MGVFGRYVFRQLAQVALIVTGALLLMVWLTQSLRFMDLIVNRGLPFGDFVHLLIFLVPWFLGIVLPIAVFVAVLFVYNRLDQESELTVCRACGLSAWQLAVPAIVVAGIATGLGYAISLYLYPKSYHAFKDLQYEIRTDHSTILLREGRFNRVSKTTTVYVAERTGDGALRNILVHSRRDDGQPVTIMAERGALVASDAGPRIVLEDGNRQHLDGPDGNLSILYFDRYALDLGASDGSVRTRWRQPQERFLMGLLYPKDTPRDQFNRNELIAEGHHRLLLPVYALAFTGVALAAIFAGGDRRSKGRAIGFAVAIVAAMYIGHYTFRNMAFRDVDLVLGIYLLATVSVATPYGLLHRLHLRTGRGVLARIRVGRSAGVDQPTSSRTNLTRSSIE